MKRNFKEVKDNYHRRESNRTQQFRRPGAVIAILKFITIAHPISDLICLQDHVEHVCTYASAHVWIKWPFYSGLQCASLVKINVWLNQLVKNFANCPLYLPTWEGRGYLRSSLLWKERGRLSRQRMSLQNRFMVLVFAIFDNSVFSFTLGLCKHRPIYGGNLYTSSDPIVPFHYCMTLTLQICSHQFLEKKW